MDGSYLRAEAVNGHSPRKQPKALAAVEFTACKNC